MAYAYPPCQNTIGEREPDPDFSEDFVQGAMCMEECFAYM